nr:neuraminidase-like domain-containing protein [Thiothrix subterranea]
MLHQLVAVQKLLDLTGLPLIKLLTFWADISTAGEKSLYSRLFLTHNMLGIDKVFKADKHGNYLTEEAKISGHLPILMATMRLKADEINTIMAVCQMPDALTLENVSSLYRYSLLAKLLHLKMEVLPDAIQLFGNPFASAQQMQGLIENWGRMEDAGFTFRQLNYLLQDHDDALRPLAPAKKTILQITKTLYDGLNAIDQEHPDLTESDREKATADFIRTKVGLLFEQGIVEQIIGLLTGSTVYTTNAPFGLNIEIPETLKAKILYKQQSEATPPQAMLQMTGILTEEERVAVKALSSEAGWIRALERLAKQPTRILVDVLFGIFPDMEEAKTVLLAGDVSVPPEQLPDPNTAPVKRFYFLQHFMPFLRRWLAHRLIVDTLSGAAGLPNDITDVLLSDILLTGGTKQPAIATLESIHSEPAETGTGWKGYLIPAVDGEYTFIAIGDTQHAPLSLDGLRIEFPYQQEDPSNVWSSNPVKLKSGKLYWLEVTDLPASALQWKTATSPKAAIPASMLLPDYSAQGTEEVFVKLYKAALLISGFNLNVDEVSYWQTHAADFDGFDFNAVTLQHWLRLQAYTTLRDRLPKTETSLFDLFQWTYLATAPGKLSETIAAATRWKQKDIDKLIAANHFNLNDPEAFRNEINLVKLQKALRMADKIRVDIDQLFTWAKPTSKFWVCHEIAQDIHKAIRSRYDQEDWEQVIKPLNDQLRENQKQALISYLLMQKALRDWGVTDADGLFEYFLIDVQMDPCFETSRIKQAISSAQLFVQRCMLGLEEHLDNKSESVPLGALDRGRWEWMQRYRVWEANRKVFLYPENWILSQLRDDKSPFYKELESELLQKDINSQTVSDALKNYLYKVDEVANMRVVGLFLEQDGDANIKLHIFSKTRNAPYFFYYRFYDVQEGNWYPWEKVQVDIPSYDHETNGQIDSSGTYLIPVVWNKRLLIFFPQFMKKTAPNPVKKDNSEEEATYEDMREKKPSQSSPIEYWEIKMGWSEYRNGKWTQKQISSEAVYDNPGTANSLPNIKNYEFISKIADESDKEQGIWINIQRYDAHLLLPQGFRFTGNLTEKTNPIGKFAPIETEFHWTDDIFYPIQSSVNEYRPELFGLCTACHDENKIVEIYAPPKIQPNPPCSNYNDLANPAIIFHYPFIHNILGKLYSGKLENLFDFYSKSISLNNYGTKETNYHELKYPYSLYNWEAAFHAPMLLVENLLNAQQFEQALKMCHYIFNPQAKGVGINRFWNFAPFKETDAQNVLETLFKKLQEGDEDTIGQVNEWRNNPFMPHVVSRSRPSAYMKWVVMKYIEILIAWGDYLFRQDTIETINQATQLYVLASHIYGPRGYKIPKRGKMKPQTYLSLKDKWDAFSNAMVELELVFPFSNQTPLVAGISNGVVGFANIFGFASSLYFCIPDNPKIRALRDTIDDRLFKIRHCQNIEGVFRKLPLFEPPIDPALLVQAAAQGLSLASVLNDLNSPLPNYRFYYLLQKSQEMCSELKTLGNAYLSAKEKGDVEALSQLRARHESSIHALTMELRTKQLEEAQKSLDALYQNRIGAVSRMQYQLKLIGEDLGKVPNIDTDFTEIQNQIEPPIDESGLKLIKYEKESIDKTGEAHDWQTAANVVEALSATFHALPDAIPAAMPLGIGTQAKIGGSHLGHASTAASKVLQIISSTASYKATSASTKGGFLRQLQDRIHQTNTTGYEIKNIDKQILTQQIRINIANQEIRNQQQQIDNAQEVEDFLRNKYTNHELYQWMTNQLMTLYRQAYEITYDLAKKAENVYRFERGLKTSSFLKGGYWEPDGMVC